MANDNHKQRRLIEIPIDPPVAALADAETREIIF
jgi:hypothetical protein